MQWKCSGLHLVFEYWSNGAVSHRRMAFGDSISGELPVDVFGVHQMQHDSRCQSYAHVCAYSGESSVFPMGIAFVARGNGPKPMGGSRGNFCWPRVLLSASLVSKNVSKANLVDPIVFVQGFPTTICGWRKSERFFSGRRGSDSWRRCRKSRSESVQEWTQLGLWWTTTQRCLSRL